jgi:hypothetical protein
MTMTRRMIRGSQDEGDGGDSVTTWRPQQRWWNGWEKDQKNIKSNRLNINTWVMVSYVLHWQEKHCRNHQYDMNCTITKMKIT